MVRNTAAVTRQASDGHSEQIEVPVGELVVGDIVHLAAGDMVPADLRLLAAKDLFISQAILTGESLPVEKVAPIHAQGAGGTSMASATALSSGTISMDARTKAKMQGYEGDPCGECGNYTLVRNGTCMKCNTCGGTSGCS